MLEYESLFTEPKNHSRRVNKNMFGTVQSKPEILGGYPVETRTPDKSLSDRPVDIINRGAGSNYSNTSYPAVDMISSHRRKPLLLIEGEDSDND